MGRIGRWCYSIRTGAKLPDDPDPPDAAVVMLKTKRLNQYLGTSYSMEEVSEMDDLVFDMIGAIDRGLNPIPKK